jgi:2-polyprenyl-6-hydroxyphenyl methylase/3-demethylubiquinone-9 3-methyltransferase
MWQAIKNAAGLMKDNGMLYIAIYTTDGKSNYWLEIKKKYNRVRPIQKRFMEFSYICRDLIIPNFLKLKNPLKTLREYKRSRGMEYFTAVKDWLGGYPYEFAKPEEVIFFCKNQLSLELMNLKTGEANTEYLFKK